MPEVGLEPTRPCGHGIVNPELGFAHAKLTGMAFRLADKGRLWRGILA